MLSLRMSTKKFLLSLGSAVLAFAFVATSCTTHQGIKFPLGQNSFAEYQKQTQEFVLKNRHFVLSNAHEELINNTPFEFIPEHPNGKAILLIHGLGDSPWTFRELGEMLSKNGYLVRGILLPGHGTKPEDMIAVDSHDWRRVVREQARLLEEKYSTVFLGGFSTGCNLATEYAYQDPKISGLLLFSPAFDVKTHLLSLVPVVGLFVDWLKRPDEENMGVAPFRYRSIPMPGLKAFKDTMDGVDQYLKSGPYDKPVLTVMSEHDSVIDTANLIQKLPKIFTNPDSVFIWYGPTEQTQDTRIQTRTDHLPDRHIESFAHMSMTYSPKNFWYGEKGKYRMCQNSFSSSDQQKCQEQKEIWYSAWGGAPKGRITARLTFNPYYDWQAEEILKFLNKAGSENIR